MTNDISHDSFETNGIDGIIQVSANPLLVSDVELSDFRSSINGEDNIREVLLENRRLTIADIMIVTAGVAICIASATLWEQELDDTLKTYRLAGWSTYYRTQFAGRAMSVLIPVSIALFVLRSIPPRPELSRLACRPGAIAMWSATIIVFFQILSLPMDVHTMGSLASPMIVASFYWPTAIFSVVFASWTILIFSGNWKPGDDLLDRLGILVGMCWIGLFPILNLIEFVLY